VRILQASVAEESTSSTDKTAPLGIKPGAFCFITVKGEKTMSYKAEVLTIGDTNYCGNGLRFRERAEAEAYALNLSKRWLAVKDYRVVESQDTPNR
jgi:hypothetical protein